jgi:hypothetical protein
LLTPHRQPHVAAQIVVTLVLTGLLARRPRRSSAPRRLDPEDLGKKMKISIIGESESGR